MEDGDARERQFSSVELNAWRGFLRTYSAVVTQVATQMERISELTLTEYEVLLKLAISPSGCLPMARLGGKAYLTLSASGLSRLVERLARRGLVVRESVVEGDKRGANVRITEEGLALWQATAGPQRRLLREKFLDPLSATELEQLAEIWSRLLRDEEPLGEDP